MKRIVQFYILIFLAVTGGCGMNSEQGNERVNQESLPETRAFKDEFTREFMKSTEETEDGFYTFKSKTKGYTMLFPVNAEISTMDYEQIKSSYEALSYSEKVHKENISYFMTVNFEDSSDTDDIQINLGILSDVSGYEGDYKEYTSGEKTIYFGEKRNEEDGYYSYAAYVTSDGSNKAVSLNYHSRCLDKGTSCELPGPGEKEKIKRIAESLKFK
ncbi:hypothetical protein [Metabacillus indicus]|uniref:hypothetical protein n=1 Tax=Metabacillus indicus TaxID=246786 RepID=UPI0004936B76|nr:hypothetical protein [Metabacillus indicus]KEZ49282.1 hypothetical protein AZ46_0214580 [Metabacillus indicus LMG 22858]